MLSMYEANRLRALILHLNLLLDVRINKISFFCSDLKEPPPQTVPTSPNMKAPPLIQAVMFNMHPVVKLDKIDPSEIAANDKKFMLQHAH